MATESAIELVATPVAPVNLFGSTSPADMVSKAAETAQALAKVIRANKLYRTIGEKNYVYVQGWTLLGSMLGVFPVCVWTRPLEEGGWEARVEARTLSGQVVGAAESQCSRNEKIWGLNPINKWGKKLEPRDDFALRSMAQTRATSKALRQPLDFIITLAGYEGTPAEEMPSEDLTEPLKASIKMVQERKRRDLEKEAAAMGAQVITRATRPKIEMPRDESLGTKVVVGDMQPWLDEKHHQAEFTAPPLCPVCKSPVGRFISESKANKGRAYWQCQQANDRVLELEEHGDLTWKQIYADVGVVGHWRTWAEPPK